MHTNEGKSIGIQGALLSLAAITLAGTVGMIGLLRQVSDLRPAVGDIITFDPLAHFSRDMKAQVAAFPVTEAPTVACMLDVQTMHASGGSLVIEQRDVQAQGAYRVHWAGTRTSNSGANCGTSVDLMVDQQDLTVLALAAGGYGVSTRKLAGSSFWTKAEVVMQ